MWKITSVAGGEKNGKKQGIYGKCNAINDVWERAFALFYIFVAQGY